MAQQTADDKSLWFAARSGDETAFSELFERYFSKLYHFALKYTRDNCLAEDLVQQAFLNCWEKKTKLGNVDDIRLYLNRCVKNGAIDIMRRQILYLRYQQQVAGQVDLADLSVAQSELQRKRDEMYTAALEHLSPQQKKVYKLSKEKGLSYAQIARELEVSTHTVKWHAAAAFQSLKVFLKRHEKELFILITGMTFFF